MNRLGREKSPYLLQHAENPVDWYPWGEEAFSKARSEDKPLFLSVGYSTCHWCHVMAHESFEDEAVAKVLNENFVPVKVDREERADVDRVYMMFVQATTGSGGWPMSVWLTPALQPFYGGTYFPPTSRWGRPGFIDVLREIARAWREDREKITRSAAQVVEQLQRFAAGGARGSSAPLDAATLERAVAEFERSYDRTNGGFGGAPKFPRPSEMLFLFREFARSGDTAARDMAIETLRAMARGGIRDHIGGGFHRYSVDARWHVPHFEKMLYDQAQLALAFLEAFQITGDAEFSSVAASILQYVARDLRSPEGAFFSAEDADSLPAATEGTSPPHPAEGAFYVWTYDEVGLVAGEDAEIARVRFGVRPGGNAADDPQGELAGKNVLFLARSVEQIAADHGQPTADIQGRLDAVAARLYAARARRPRPGLDDKVIASWNGLMIAAFARAARVLGDEWLPYARDAASFVRRVLWQSETGTLLRRYRVGEAGVTAYADDFASLIFGLIELFQADGDPAWLEWALALQRRQDELFWDESNGGWFSTTGDDPSVLVRLKDESDGAEPAASSLSAWNLMALARLSESPALSSRMEAALSAFASMMRASPRGVPMMLAALSSFLAPKHEIVIVGARGSEEGRRLIAALASRYLPFAVIVPVEPHTREALARLLPFTEAMTMRDGRATAYVCRDYSCRQPTSDPAEMLREMLE